MSLLTGSANCIKYVLFAFNAGFMLTGIILIAVGTGVSSTYNQYKLFLLSKFFSIPTFLIVIGSLVIIIAIFGCWGALKENYFLILIFSVLLGVIFILELSAGISGYVLRSNAEELIRGELKTQLEKYTRNKSSDVEIMWDYIQNGFGCCGVDNYTDWQKKFNDELPFSCCAIPTGAVGSLNCTTRDQDILKAKGCLEKFSDTIAEYAISLGAAGVVIGIIQFFGVIFSCYIAREIKIRNGISGLM